MPSSWSASLRFELQFTGEQINLWGDHLNTVIQHTDYSIAGWLTKALTGNYTLTTANAGDDEARAAMLKFTGAGPFTVTIPSVSKSYLVWNACSAALKITTGAGADLTMQPGERAVLGCDGANIYRFQGADFGGARVTSVGDPLNPQDGATKKYVDDAAFSAAGGNLPGQAGSAGKFLTTNGSVPGWADAVTKGIGFATASGDTVNVAPATVTDIRTGSSARAMSAGGGYDALAIVPIADAPTIVIDFSTFINGSISLAGNRILGNPINSKVGQTGFLYITPNTFTLSVGSSWKTPGGAQAASTGAGAVDVWKYEVITPTYILYAPFKNPS